AESKDDVQRHADAVDVLRMLSPQDTPDEPEKALAEVMARHGDVGKLAFEWALGEVWSRQVLPPRDRSLIVIAVIAVLGNAREMAIHVPAALNLGLTQDDLREIMVQLCVYAGFPRAVDGLILLEDVFRRLDSPE